MATNNYLWVSKMAKDDEFYTRYEDIEKELRYYEQYFEGKTVYCNCDDGNTSNFYKFFKDNFTKLKLRKLIATNYDIGYGAWSYVYDGTDSEAWPLNGNGDFRSDECIAFLKEADIVVTNPPFSLFRKYVKQLMDYDKKFLIIGNNNAITYKDVFPYIKNDELWFGVSPRDMGFIRPDGTIKRVNANWFTNLDHQKRNQPIPLNRTFTSDKYPKYDGYDVIEVSKIVDIPVDYDGVMGVPITFLNKYCPKQFEILGLANNLKYIGDFPCLTVIDGKSVYNRILIRKR